MHAFVFTATVLVLALNASLHVKQNSSFMSTKSHQTGLEVIRQKLTRPVVALVPLLSLDSCAFCSLLQHSL